MELKDLIETYISSASTEKYCSNTDKTGIHGDFEQYCEKLRQIQTLPDFLDAVRVGTENVHNDSYAALAVLKMIIPIHEQ